VTRTETLVIDASVAVKWFLPPELEPGAADARALVGRHDLRTTTLAHFEIAAVLARSWPTNPQGVTRALAVVRAVCGSPLDLTADAATVAAELSSRHAITFYDASYAAIARLAGHRLVSTDRHLLNPGLAIAPRDLSGR